MGSVYESIMRGLQQALDYSSGKNANVRVEVVTIDDDNPENVTVEAKKPNLKSTPTENQ